jgi:hypothetical protein
MKYLVVCTSGKWQLPIILKAKSRGLTCIAIDEDANAPGLDLADYQIVSKLNETEHIASEIRKITNKILGAISFCSDAGIPLAQFLNRDFQCSPRLLFSAESAVNKVVQRKLWLKDNVNQPKFAIFTNSESAYSFGSTANLPFVVKPSDSSGSRGVTIVRQPLEIKEAIEQAQKFAKSDEIIIEDFMAGTEYTVEVIAIDSEVHTLLITRKEKVSESARTVSRELVSISPESPWYQMISTLAISAFKSLGINNGPGHLEMIVNESSGPVGVVEAACRGGGFNLAARFVEVTTGFRLTDACLAPFLDENIFVEDLGYKPSILFFQPTQKGRLVRMLGIEEAEKIEGVEIEILGEPGTVYGDPATDGDRLCTVIISAPTSLELARKKKRVENLLKFEFEEF